jgi:hypothetical protein
LKSAVLKARRFASDELLGRVNELEGFRHSWCARLSAIDWLRHNHKVSSISTQDMLMSYPGRAWSLI